MASSKPDHITKQTQGPSGPLQKTPIKMARGNKDVAQQDLFKTRLNSQHCRENRKFPKSLSNMQRGNTAVRVYHQRCHSLLSLLQSTHDRHL